MACTLAIRLALESSALPSSPKTLSARQVSTFRRRLLRWFDREQRTLPWRGERDPYRILVSEIMLQQTRVAVVEERYRLFVTQFRRLPVWPVPVNRLCWRPGAVLVTIAAHA